MSVPISTADEETTKKSAHVIARGNASGFMQEVVAGKHHLLVDEPVSMGGSDAAPGPYDYLLIALGGCTSMTIGSYARRKQSPLENITVSLSHSRIHAKDCEKCETKEGMLDQIDISIELTGALTPEQRAKLMEIAEKCPVHRTLERAINIQESAVPAKQPRSVKELVLFPAAARIVLERTRKFSAARDRKRSRE